MADRLHSGRGRSYSVERESHVIDEKEPDIRLRAQAADVSLAVEIKIPESWTLDELDLALRDQLCGRYLRARNARHGILLLVHKKAHRWRDEDGRLRDFAAIVNRLRALAISIAGALPDAPQPEIAIIDVTQSSTNGPATNHRRKARGKSAVAKSQRKTSLQKPQRMQAAKSSGSKSQRKRQAKASVAKPKASRRVSSAKKRRRR